MRPTLRLMSTLLWALLSTIGEPGHADAQPVPNPSLRPGPMAATAQIVVDGSSRIAKISADELGANLGTWYNVLTASLPRELASLGAHALRWPGGSIADQYHWRSHSSCSARNKSAPAYDPNSTFDNFMSQIAIPGHYDVAVTVDYGSNTTCSGGGDPSEAAAWVAYAKAKGYNSHLHYWTVGNEVFGNWEFDLHSSPHDPNTYANAMSGPNGYYHLMKSADPSAQVGAFVVGESDSRNWDSIVLSKAPYDFVELHWYAQQPGSESDRYLLYQAPAALTHAIATLRSELRSAGNPTTPIMLGEFNSVAYNPGKQTMSIVNALFAGMAFGELLKDELSVATWWFGAGGTQGCNNNNSSNLYGWQNFGGYDLVAANSAYGWNYCTNNNGPKIVPEGTLVPSSNSFALISQFSVPGNSMLSASVSSSLPDIRAYAATQGSGYALMLFNLNETTNSTVTVGITSAARNSYSISTLTYGKQQYDNSKSNIWTGPVAANLGSTGTSTTVTLPPWSMTILKFH